ncbi:MAG TPA: extracellular solute-binding protein, partial [Spirochaetia bacterium]|nr:extracellular solute-binding protein [Spirochaetia bacterium]
DTMWMIWQQSGAQIFDRNGRPDLTNPEFRKFILKWRRWEEMGVFAEWNWGNFSDLMKNGTYASYIAPDWWVFQVNAAAEEGRYRFKARALPLYTHGGPRTSSWGGTFLAIPKTASDPARLKEIIEYLAYDREMLIEQYRTGGMIPVLRSTWDDPVFHKPDPRFGGQRLAELQTALSWESPVINVGDGFWEAVEEFKNIYPEIQCGDLTVEEGLRRVQETVLRRIR